MLKSKTTKPDSQFWHDVDADMAKMRPVLLDNRPEDWAIRYALWMLLKMVRHVCWRVEQ